MDHAQRTVDIIKRPGTVLFIYLVYLQVYGHPDASGSNSVLSSPNTTNAYAHQSSFTTFPSPSVSSHREVSYPYPVEIKVSEVPPVQSGKPVNQPSSSQQPPIQGNPPSTLPYNEPSSTVQSQSNQQLFNQLSDSNQSYQTFHSTKEQPSSVVSTRHNSIEKRSSVYDRRTSLLLGNTCSTYPTTNTRNTNSTSIN